MKYLWPILILILTLFSKFKQSILIKNEPVYISNNCHESGNCNFETFHNKSLKFL